MWEDIDWGVRINAITHTGDGGGRQSLLPVCCFPCLPWIPPSIHPIQQPIYPYPALLPLACPCPSCSSCPPV